MPVTRWDITLHVEDGEIIGVTGPSGEGVPMTLENRKQFKKSKYGLRSVSVLRAHDSNPSALTEIVRKCYMVIGGFRVEVPCS